ncbi:MAG: FtsQ-type POTRA domain-containing protein [Ruminococcus sp.]|nr:FtsQ-type POTRA domain-containing protein [Ruminococcus sp.]
MQDVVKTNVKRKQNSKRTRRRRRNMSLYILLVAVLVLGIFVALSLTLFFNVNTVKVIGETGYEDTQIVAVSGIQNGDNLVRLDEFAVREKLLAGLLNVEDVAIKKRYPSTVEITVSPCIPGANIACESGYLLVSEKGKILDLKTEADGSLLTVTGLEPASLTIGTYLTSTDPQKDKIFETLTKAIRDKQYDTIVSVNLTDKYDIHVNYENRIDFALGNSNEINYKLELAAAAIKEISTEKSYVLRMVGSNQISVQQKQDMTEELITDLPEITTIPPSETDFISTATTAVSAE